MVAFHVVVPSFSTTPLRLTSAYMTGPASIFTLTMGNGQPSFKTATLKTAPSPNL